MKVLNNLIRKMILPMNELLISSHYHKSKFFITMILKCINEYRTPNNSKIIIIGTEFKSKLLK
jgi:hypothetical protein